MMNSCRRRTIKLNKYKFADQLFQISHKIYISILSTATLQNMNNLCATHSSRVSRVRCISKAFSLASVQAAVESFLVGTLPAHCAQQPRPQARRQLRCLSPCLTSPICQRQSPRPCCAWRTCRRQGRPRSLAARARARTALCAVSRGREGVELLVAAVHR
jgi:hypothetical protein